MNYRMKRIASCLLAGAIVISGTGVGTYGAQTGGVSAVIATGLSSNGSPAAGFSKMLSQCLIESDKAVMRQQPRQRSRSVRMMFQWLHLSTQTLQSHR